MNKPTPPEFQDEQRGLKEKSTRPTILLGAPKALHDILYEFHRQVDANAISELGLETVQMEGLGLHPLDVAQRITPVTDVTTPRAPTEVTGQGFDREVGLTWHLDRQLGHVTGVEVRRATLANMADAVSLGEASGAMFIDDNSRQGYGDSVTRYYQVRTVNVVGSTKFFSSYTPTTPVALTTLPLGATQADLQARVDAYLAQIQSRHLLPGAVDVQDMNLTSLQEDELFAFFLGG
jgi:hypothetical protein